MSEQKKINIDMNLFKVSNKTRKKKPSEQTDGIKIKQPSQKKKNESLKKKSILKMIRQHQEERYNNLFDDKKKQTVPSKSEESSVFNKEFEEAQKFLQNLTEKTTINHTPKNTTLKQYPTTNSLLYHPSIDSFSDNNTNTFVPSNPIKEVTNSIINTSLRPSNILLNPVVNNTLLGQPNYGCLKNGQLPTYRNYMNKTQKVFNNPIVSGGNINNVKPLTTEIRNDVIDKKLNDSMNRVNNMKQIEQKLQQIKQNYKPKKMKRKKTIRRTYKVGKSKIFPKVSVLVSNKTIRSNITTKSQLLKQVSIEEVKKHLIKQGLIKVGTISPNDVLRKMYESSILMCGELNNHNPDNLLYNFINGPK